VGVFVFLFFLFFIAGHYLGVLLGFNGGTACFIDPWCQVIPTWQNFCQKPCARRSTDSVLPLPPRRCNAYKFSTGQERLGGATEATTSGFCGHSPAVHDISYLRFPEAGGTRSATTNSAFSQKKKWAGFQSVPRHPAARCKKTQGRTI
jgi:hypothetical protein